MNIYLRYYFALEVNMTAFWKVTGHQVKCKDSRYKHPVSETANFCEVCGAPVVRIPLTEPTESFRKFCEEQDSTPEETFQLLTEERWEWSDAEDYRGTLRLGLHAVQAVVKADQKDEHQRWGLGIKFGSFKAGDPTRGPSFSCGVPHSTLVAAEKAVREIAELFGLKGEPAFYSQIEFQV